jgi:hypothetical protein
MTAVVARRGGVAAALAALLVALLGGAAVARGGEKGMLLVGAGAALVILLVTPLVTMPRIARTYLAIEAPVILLLLSTLVFRVRDTTALAQNPLDAAAAYRVLCVTAALILAWIALLQPTRAQRARIPFEFKLYVVYVGVVFLGAVVSVDPQLTAYRGFELLTGIAAIAGVWHTAGPEAIERIERLLYRFVVTLVVLVWIGVALYPGRATIPSHPIPIAIQGVYPNVASNGVGDLGAILLLWTLGRLVSRRSDINRRVGYFLVAVGAVTLVAAQYRTGYVGLVVTLFVLALARGRLALAVVALVGAIVVGWFSFHAVVHDIQPYALRGESTDQAKTLSGRLTYWRAAIPVWRESPAIGRGLGTASRFQVLAPLGQGTTSTVHGTWIEVLVGTGVVGVVLLAVFLLRLWWLALWDLLSRWGRVWPSLVVTFVIVHSLTGSTFELFGYYTLLLLALAFSLTTGSRGAPAAAGAGPAR